MPSKLVAQREHCYGLPSPNKSTKRRRQLRRRFGRLHLSLPNSQHGVIMIAGVQDSSMRSGAMLTNWRFVCNAYAATEAGHRLMFLRMPGVNRQGQAHIVSTAIVSPGSGKGGREVGATPWFRTWFSIDPQPASINPTINISIVFICAFLVDCGRI